MVNPNKNNKIQSMKKMKLGLKKAGNNQFIRKLPRSLTLKAY